MLLVFMVFGMTGLAMTTLPLHVHQGLGQSAFMVGLVAGSQFAAALMSRLWSGHLCDRKGPLQAIRIGLFAASSSGLLYLLSLRTSTSTDLSIGLLLAGRALMGGAESFVVTGALAWGMSNVPASESGRVMAWIGTAMYTAFGLGAPFGLSLYERHGLAAISLVTMALPLTAFALLGPVGHRITAAGTPRPRRSRETWRAVWRPGLGLALGSIGFAAVTTFLTLLQVERGWLPSWIGVSAFSAAFVLVRIVGPHLPDRYGGPRIAFVSLLVEAIGLGLIATADGPALAAIGAVLTGGGYSLVFPGLGIEVVRRAPDGNRALALGTYTACLDLALCLSGPVLGGLVARAGLQAAFGCGAVAVASAMLVAWALARPASVA